MTQDVIEPKFTRGLRAVGQIPAQDDDPAHRTAEYHKPFAPARMLELSIVIPTLNRLDTLLPCLDSIGRHTAVPHEIIVYANACHEETARQLEARPTVVPLLDTENRFFTEAVNAGIARARGRYVFLLNDDKIGRAHV